jgi:hypothetical protein
MEEGEWGKSQKLKARRTVAVCQERPYHLIAEENADEERAREGERVGVVVQDDENNTHPTHLSSDCRGGPMRMRRERERWGGGAR